MMDLIAAAREISPEGWFGLLICVVGVIAFCVNGYQNACRKIRQKKIDEFMAVPPVFIRLEWKTSHSVNEAISTRVYYIPYTKVAIHDSGTKIYIHDKQIKDELSIVDYTNLRAVNEALLAWQKSNSASWKILDVVKFNTQDDARGYWEQVNREGVVPKSYDKVY